MRCWTNMERVKEKIKELEEEIRKTPYNKATQYHIGGLKRKISKLKQEIVAQAKKDSARSRISVKKKGDATAVLVGFPSVGKSTLLNAITEADSRVGAYEFTTLEAIPGMMKYKGAEIQIVDLPGIIEEASIGRGQGREILSHARIADLFIILIEIKKPQHYKIIKEELYEAGMRLDTAPPKVKVSKTDRGGVKIEFGVKNKKIDKPTAIAICRKYKIHNANIVIYEDISPEEFEDVLAGNRHYCESINVVNKIDIGTKKDWKQLDKLLGEYVKISAEKNTGLEELKEAIYNKLEFIRIYTDDDEPMIMKRGSTIRDLANKIHKEMVKKFKHAKVTGKSVRFKDQMVGLDHIIQDGDLVKILT